MCHVCSANLNEKRHKSQPLRLIVSWFVVMGSNFIWTETYRSNNIYVQIYEMLGGAVVPWHRGGFTSVKWRAEIQWLLAFSSLPGTSIFFFFVVVCFGVGGGG